MSDVLLGLLVLGMLIAHQAATDRLNNPQDTQVVLLEQVPSLVTLSMPGPYLITVLRQSGNVHSEQTVSSPEAAVKAALATFRRAKIDAVHIGTNESDRLAFRRLFHNHRGSNEGKKVGAVEIVRLD